jgi:hypothetical protein
MTFGWCEQGAFILFVGLCPLHSLQIETAHIEGQLQGIMQSFDGANLIGIVAQSVSDSLEISELYEA